MAKKRRKRKSAAARSCACRKGSWHKIIKRRVRGRKTKTSVFMCQSKRTHKFTKKVCR